MKSLFKPSVKRIVSILVLIFIPLFAYQNCGAPGTAAKSSSSYFAGSINTNCPANPKLSKISESLSDNESFTDLVVVVDNACVRSTAGISKMSRQALAKGVRNDMKIAAYRLTVPPTKLSEIKSELAADHCIESVSKPFNYQLFSTSAPAISFPSTTNLSTFAVSGSSPNDPRYTSQPHLPFIGYDDVYAYVYNANNGIKTPVRLGIVDSGVDMQHPDLSPNFLKDGTGNPVGYDAMSGTPGYVTDAGFHGTHVAGLAAAVSNNGLGVSGVQGDQVQLVAIKVGESSGNVLDPNISLEALVNGIRWGADQGVEVMNISLGGVGDAAGPAALRDALIYAVNKGVTVFVAAGNGDSAGIGYKIDNSDSTKKVFPAGFAESIDGVIAVASVDVTSKGKSSFSNYSNTIVSIAAPGSNGTTGMLSTVPTTLSSNPYASRISITSNGATRVSPIHGTSMASPVAAGAGAMGVALLKSRGFKPLPSQVKKLMALGSIKNSALASYVTDGNTVNLTSMVAFIDQQTHVSSKSTAMGDTAYGTINIQSQPSNQTVALGGNANFTVTLSSDSTIFPEYQWYRNGAIITGANKPRLDLAGVAQAHLGTYKVVIKAGTTSVTSNEVTLASNGTVAPSPGPQPNPAPSNCP